MSMNVAAETKNTSNRVLVAFVAVLVVLFLYLAAWDGLTVSAFRSLTTSKLLESGMSGLSDKKTVVVWLILIRAGQHIWGRSLMTLLRKC